MVDIMEEYDSMAKAQQSAFTQQENSVGINRPSPNQDPFVQAVNAGNFSSIVGGNVRGGTKPKVNPLQGGMDITKGFEGYKDHAYDDATGDPWVAGQSTGHKTGGYGTLLDSNTDYSQYTEKDWDNKFGKDYKTKRGEIENYFGSDWAGMPPEVQDTVSDLSYNMGTSGLTTKFPGFISDIKAGNYGDAAENLKYEDPNAANPVKNKWWGEMGGDKYAANNWANPLENRGNYHYNQLTSLGNATRQSVPTP